MPTPKLSVPGWTLATIATVTLLTQIPNALDPLAFMQEFNIQSKPAAQLITFLLILVNIYDLQGALSNNYFVFYFSLVSRAAATALFWGFGEEWRMMVGVESTTFGLLGGALLWEAL
ncbi:hypothetical protein LSUE1_G010137, partial [Lachnellula suecica]